jgi:hypothetical protein
LAKTISWTGPTKYVDGTPYGQADHGGYELEINGSLSVAVPVAWQQDNTYELPVAGVAGIVQGDNTARMRTVAANGQVSDWTGSVTFRHASIPDAPSALVVA